MHEALFHISFREEKKFHIGYSLKKFTFPANVAVKPILQCTHLDSAVSFFGHCWGGNGCEGLDFTR